MIRTALVAGCLLAAQPALAAPALASCRIAGDCIALGLGQALPGCTTDAAVGIPAAAVVARARPGGAHPGGSDVLVVSAGSNDVPRGLPATRYARARAGIEAALAAILAGRGQARLILVLPANGARPIVARWAAGHGVRAVGFAAGADGVHPASYRALGRAVLSAMGAGA